MKRLQAVVALLTLLWGPCASAADSWEGVSISERALRTCRPFLRSLVIPVPAEQRPAAVQMLSKDQGLVLDDTQASMLLGKSAPATGSLLNLIVGDAIGTLQNKKAQVANQVGGLWSHADQEELDALMRFGADHGTALKPLLVRAISNSEEGVFDAEDCAGVLHISHVSSAVETKIIHMPVIVFVDHLPVGVSSWWELIKGGR